MGDGGRCAELGDHLLLPLAGFSGAGYPHRAGAKRQVDHAFAGDDSGPDRQQRVDRLRAVRAIRRDQRPEVGTGEPVRVVGPGRVGADDSLRLAAGQNELLAEPAVDVAEQAGCGEHLAGLPGEPPGAQPQVAGSTVAPDQPPENRDAAAGRVAELTVEDVFPGQDRGAVQHVGVVVGEGGLHRAQQDGRVGALGQFQAALLAGGCPQHVLQDGFLGGVVVCGAGDGHRDHDGCDCANGGGQPAAPPQCPQGQRQ